MAPARKLRASLDRVRRGPTAAESADRCPQVPRSRSSLGAGAGGYTRLLLIPCLLAIALLAAAASAEAKPGALQPQPSPIANGRLFDLGVSDYDHDGRPEIFSTNHKFLGTFSERNVSGWSNLLGSSRLSPSPDYPGFEDLLTPPSIVAPGLYIYAESRTTDENDDVEDTPLLHIVANRITGIPLLPERAEGSVILPSPDVQVVRTDGAQAKVSRVGNPPKTRVDFSVAEQGEITLKVKNVDFPPIDFQIDQAPLLARTYIGADKVPASGPRFTLQLIDRHGIAWADTNRDGRTDAFIARGGLGGGIAKYIGRITDELQVQSRSGGTFSDQIAGSGLVKGGCRGRQAASVDYNADGLLDIFESCKTDDPKLYRQLNNGKFVDASKRLGRASPDGSYYRWVDVRGNSRPELIVAGKKRAVVLSSKGKARWKVAQRVKTFNGARLVHSVSFGDYDADGDPDLFIGATSGNTLLTNRGGRLVARKPVKLGLPGHGTGSSFVDYNNDGRLDLHSIPVRPVPAKASRRLPPHRDRSRQEQGGLGDRQLVRLRRRRLARSRHGDPDLGQEPAGRHPPAAQPRQLQPLAGDRPPRRARQQRGDRRQDPGQDRQADTIGDRRRERRIAVLPGQLPRLLRPRRRRCGQQAERSLARGRSHQAHQRHRRSPRSRSRSRSGGGGGAGSAAGAPRGTAAQRDYHSRRAPFVDSLDGDPDRLPDRLDGDRRDQALVDRVGGAVEPGETAPGCGGGCAGAILRRGRALDEGRSRAGRLRRRAGRGPGRRGRGPRR